MQRIVETLYLVYISVPECPVKILGLFNLEQEARDYKNNFNIDEAYKAEVIDLVVDQSTDEVLPFAEYVELL